MKTEIKSLLGSVRDGAVSVDEALLKLKTAPYEDIGYAKVDLLSSTVRSQPQAAIFKQR